MLVFESKTTGTLTPHIYSALLSLFFFFFTQRSQSRALNVSFFLSLVGTATTWFLPRVLKSYSESSSRPSTRWCSPQRASSGQTDIWRTSTPISGRATGFWVQEVGHPGWITWLLLLTTMIGGQK